MAQRQNRMAVPVNPYDSYEAYKAVQKGEVVNRPLKLNTLFSELDDTKRDNLTFYYLLDLDHTIVNLQRNCLYTDEARKFYNILNKMHLSNRASFEIMQFPQEDLVTLIHATKALIITSPLLQDGNANPQYAKRINNFDKLIHKYKHERLNNLYDGFVRAANALVASAFTALVVLLSVIGTFGILSIAALGVGGLIIAKQSVLAAGHYGVAAKQKTMFEAMQPLVNAVQNQRKTVGK